ncbi:InlB B-repeat-containing protein [uncultured Treponema sp.]|uniref:InlB B-repeat-containing protein n=1 Tax=uncultured Treponema sp. TaxID=162155 RepID=UPI0025E57FA5|nr:InlB B-repeat-containing protein [uncultured Treponema sp.]
MHKIPKALTFMGALLALTFCAVSCKTDDDNEPTMYTVTVSDSLEHGKVTADKSSAEAGAKVKLTATADSGYELNSYSVKDASANELTVTNGTFTMPESNVTVTATFTALPPATATYTVKHLQQNVADDNYTLKESETKTGTVGQPTAANAKSYEGFTAQTVTQVTITASGTEVEIKYDRKSYTVTFNANGGSTVTSQSVRYGATATKPAVPSKNGFVFIGWYSDTGLESAFNFDTAITGAITLYAKWTETALPAITLSCATPTVAKGDNITGTVVFNNFETEPTAVDLYVEGQESPFKSNAQVTEGAFTINTKNLQVGTHKVYVKSGSVESNHISVTITEVTYTVSIASGIEHGTVMADKTSAEKDATVTLTLSASDGYEFGTLSVTDASNAEITAAAVTEGSKYTFTMPESNVTVNATFTEMRTEASGKIGKYEKPYKVGDIVFSDGSATPYSADLTLSDAQKQAAVAVIYYAGSVEDVLGAKTLGVGLKNTRTDSTLAWAISSAAGYSTNITAIKCTPSAYGKGAAATATFTGDTDGSDNWQALCEAVSDEGTSGNYPAWEWVNAYATTALLTGDYASGWYLPTVAELSMLYRVKDTVNSALEKAGGTEIANAYYWSSSHYASYFAEVVGFAVDLLTITYKYRNFSVCTVRAF